MNNVILMGRLGKDPEVRYSHSQDGDLAISRCSLGVKRDFARKDEQDTDWIQLVAFGKTAENIGKYFSKGDRIAISGRIQTGSYTNKDGVKVYTTEVVVEKFDFIENKSKGSLQEEPVNPGNLQSAPKEQIDSIPDLNDDDLPFC